MTDKDKKFKWFIAEFTDEHNRKISRNKKGNAFYLRDKYKDIHLRNNGWFPHISHKLGEVIGEWDVENDQRLIPNIFPKSDPFKAFDGGDWDISTIENLDDFKNIKLWLPNKKFVPVRSYIYKHQNPKTGVLGRNVEPTTKRATLFCVGSPVNRGQTEKIEASNYDKNKLWRIEGMAVPVGTQPTDGYWRDYSGTAAFPYQFSFGKRLTRTYYAVYHTKLEKFMYTSKLRKRTGTQFSKYPVFIDTSVVKWAQRFIATGFDKDEYYNDCVVVRYHFNPLVSFKYDKAWNTLRPKDATSYYNKQDKEIAKYNYYAFRYHIKMLEKKRNKF